MHTIRTQGRLRNEFILYHEKKCLGENGPYEFLKARMSAPHFGPKLLNLSVHIDLLVGPIGCLPKLLHFL